MFLVSSVLVKALSSPLLQAAVSLQTVCTPADMLRVLLQDEKGSHFVNSRTHRNI